MTTLRWYGASATETYSGTASLSGTGSVAAGGGIAGIKLRVFNVSASGGLSTSAVLGGFGSITVDYVRSGGVKLQLFRISSVDTQRLRVYEISAGSGLNPTLRWYKVDGVSAADPPVIADFGELTREPSTSMTLTATLEAGSSTPDSWFWRVIDSPAPVTLFGATTATVSFTTPSQFPPDYGATPLVLGVQAIKDTVFSAEVEAQITILPNLDWTWDGTQWQASVVTKVR